MLTPMGLILTLAGCGFGLDIFLPSTVTITFVNEFTDLSIEGTVVFDNREAFIKEDLVGFGEERSFSVDGGQSLSLTPLSCGEVESLVLDRAELLVVGNVGPSTDSEILRIGEDFDCGDEIVFTFTGSILDLNVSTAAR
jgi:hypothetical protein